MARCDLKFSFAGVSGANEKGGSKMATCRITQKKGIPDDYTAMVAALMPLEGLCTVTSRAIKMNADDMTWKCMIPFKFA